MLMEDDVRDDRYDRYAGEPRTELSYDTETGLAVPLVAVQTVWGNVLNRIRTRPCRRSLVHASSSCPFKSR